MVGITRSKVISCWVVFHLFSFLHLISELQVTPTPHGASWFSVSVSLSCYAYCIWSDCILSVLTPAFLSFLHLVPPQAWVPLGHSSMKPPKWWSFWASRAQQPGSMEKHTWLPTLRDDGFPCNVAKHSYCPFLQIWKQCVLLYCHFDYTPLSLPSSMSSADNTVLSRSFAAWAFGQGMRYSKMCFETWDFSSFPPYEGTLDVSSLPSTSLYLRNHFFRYGLLDTIVVGDSVFESSDCILPRPVAHTQVP